MSKHYSYDVDSIDVIHQSHKSNEQSLVETARALSQHADRFADPYHQMSDMRRRVREKGISGRDVRLASIYAVTSIKTDTRIINSLWSDMRDSMNNFSEMKRILESSTDGDVKWEKYHEFFTSDIPDRVANLLNEAHNLSEQFPHMDISDLLNDASALLTGRDIDTGGHVTDTYLRTVKSSFVLYLLGFDRICMDTRIFNTFKPVMQDLLTQTNVRRAQTSLQNPYRNRSPRTGGKSVPVISHSGDYDNDFESSYWEDTLKWNPQQYDTMTKYLRDEVYSQMSDEFDKSLVQQMAFNCSGDGMFFHLNFLEALTE